MTEVEDILVPQSERETDKTQDIAISTPPPTNPLDVVCPLPVLFLCSIFIIAVLNMTNFFSSYKIALEEKPNNKQAALSSIESKYTDSFAGKTNYIDINGLFARLVDKKEVNGIVRLENGYLTGMIPQGDIEIFSENFILFSEYLSLSDIPLAYIQAPSVLPTDDDEMLPKGYETFVNDNANQFLSILQEAGISTYDLREEIVNDGLNHYELFYKTDNHWTIEAAFWASGKIGQFMEEELKTTILNPMYLDLDNYNLETYSNIWLGSRGQRTGVFYADLDDGTIITPKFETSLYSETLEKSGDFYEVLVNKNVPSTDTNAPLVQSFYGATYLTGSELFHLKNLYANNDLKVFIIRDSYMVATCPFLSLQFSEIVLFDLRQTDNSYEKMLQKIEEYQPDIVLQIITADSLNSPKLFEYLTPQALSQVEASRRESEVIFQYNTQEANKLPSGLILYQHEFEIEANTDYKMEFTLIEEDISAIEIIAVDLYDGPDYDSHENQVRVESIGENIQVFLNSTDISMVTNGTAQVRVMITVNDEKESMTLHNVIFSKLL